MTRRLALVLVSVFAVAALTPTSASAAKPVRSFAVSTTAVTEFGGNAVVLVTRSVKGGRVSVHLSTADGTATAGSDYTSVSQTVQFKGGQNSVAVSVPIVADSDAEPNETILLGLSAPSSGYTTIDGVLTIINDDAPANAPTGLDATTLSPTSIGLTWDSASEHVTGWDVYRGTSSGNLSFVGDTEANSFTDDGLESSTTYYYAVVATNNAGDSPMSSEANATTTGLTVIDNLEGSTSGWSATGLWHLTDDSSCSPSGTHSATHAFYYGLDGTCTFDNGVANSGVLMSPNYTGATGKTQFVIRYALETENSGCDTYDISMVEVSYDDGTTWSPLAGGDCLAESSTWRTRSFAIAPTGDTVRFRFSFDTADDIANEHLGWFVDDLALG